MGEQGETDNMNAKSLTLINSKPTKKISLNANSLCTDGSYLDSFSSISTSNLSLTSELKSTQEIQMTSFYKNYISINVDKDSFNLNFTKTQLKIQNQDSTLSFSFVNQCPFQLYFNNVDGDTKLSITDINLLQSQESDIQIYSQSLDVTSTTLDTLTPIKLYMDHLVASFENSCPNYLFSFNDLPSESTSSSKISISSYSPTIGEIIVGENQNVLLPSSLFVTNLTGGSSTIHVKNLNAKVLRSSCDEPTKSFVIVDEGTTTIDEIIQLSGDLTLTKFNVGNGFEGIIIPIEDSYSLIAAYTINAQEYVGTKTLLYGFKFYNDFNDFDFNQVTTFSESDKKLIYSQTEVLKEGTFDLYEDHTISSYDISLSFDGQNHVYFEHSADLSYVSLIVSYPNYDGEFGINNWQSQIRDVTKDVTFIIEEPINSTTAIDIENQNKIVSMKFIGVPTTETLQIHVQNIGNFPRYFESSDLSINVIDASPSIRGVTHTITLISTTISKSLSATSFSKIEATFDSLSSFNFENATNSVITLYPQENANIIRFENGQWEFGNTKKLSNSLQNKITIDGTHYSSLQIDIAQSTTSYSALNVVNVNEISVSGNWSIVHVPALIIQNIKDESILINDHFSTVVPITFSDEISDKTVYFDSNLNELQIIDTFPYDELSLNMLTVSNRVNLRIPKIDVKGDIKIYGELVIDSVNVSNEASLVVNDATVSSLMMKGKSYLDSPGTLIKSVTMEMNYDLTPCISNFHDDEITTLSLSSNSSKSQWAEIICGGSDFQCNAFVERAFVQRDIYSWKCIQRGTGQCLSVDVKIKSDETSGNNSKIGLAIKITVGGLLIIGVVVVIYVFVVRKRMNKYSKIKSEDKEELGYETL
ncbi:hypothetical protein GPJ56_002656 [Histomonas meleagridis]|uniref:uncharacterized protein n=1 Tax=Histomonas meleagridis TaxID=135588 RepID=UPI003559B97E|nr:hypothetical protein GPJ56_002656 [Histomonas meleagridis]KAH0797877.1 hypothetical protein GO595_009506 [Histomonas meleagridis]